MKKLIIFFALLFFYTLSCYSSDVLLSGSQLDISVEKLWVLKTVITVPASIQFGPGQKVFVIDNPDSRVRCGLVLDRTLEDINNVMVLSGSKQIVFDQRGAVPNGEKTDGTIYGGLDATYNFNFKNIGSLKLKCIVKNMGGLDVNTFAEVLSQKNIKLEVFSEEKEL